MRREFVVTSVFRKQWEAMELSDDDLRELENYLMQNPSAGDIIQGTGGASKVRFALPGKGKSGGLRVIFVDITSKARIYLLLCFAKAQQEDLTEKQKQQLKSLVRTMKGEE